MPKKIISLALSENTVEAIDRTSKALGMNRSQFIELMVKKGFHFSKEVLDSVNEISELQEKAKNRIHEAKE